MITRLPQSEGNILGYEVTNTVTEDEYKQVLTEVRAAIEQYGKVRLMARVPETVGSEISTLDNRLGFLKDHRDDVERYALVGDDRLVEWASSIANLATGFEVRHFKLDDETAAWTWLRS